MPKASYVIDLWVSPRSQDQIRPCLFSLLLESIGLLFLHKNQLHRRRHCHAGSGFLSLSTYNPKASACPFELPLASSSSSSSSSSSIR
eukprot:scaffold3687_cov240-Pinguiococcus_pyrenoidosus.AAC.13